MIQKIVSIVKNAGEAVPASEIARRLGVATDDQHRDLVCALGVLLFDQRELHYDQQTGGYRALQDGEAP